MNKILLFIIISIVLFFTYGIYANISKKNIKSKRVICQKQTVTFESIYNLEKISKAQKLFFSKNYKVKSSIKYSVFMPTRLKEFFDVKRANDILQRNIYIENIIKTDKKVLVDYYIYENDKDDKNKKHQDSKLYAGYLVFEFILDNETVYKIQTDYMKQDGSDIENRIKCVIKSFQTIK
ncbi:MAG: hypothetical protein ACNI28_01680 [Arcobacter sp.]|uniref:hypothetical protein n=1 Tax=Arcobacter sp. TaxID=1872629 RepID=UPI003B004327